MTDLLLTASGRHECATCGHEGGDTADPYALGEIRDANGTCCTTATR